MNIISREQLKQRAGQAGGLMICISLVMLIASMYVGHAKSPYGVCYAESGRDVPCELVAHH